jgi:hypothetical protein
MDNLKSAKEWFGNLNIAEKIEILEVYYPDDMYRGNINDLWKHLDTNLKIEAYQENHEIYGGKPMKQN